jgi:UDP-N-acetylmuramoylalanine--D-glutamate ligase
MDNFEELKKSRIGIFGYGSEGQSLFRFLISKDCSKIKVFDEKAQSQILDNESEIFSGNFEDGDYSDLDIVFRSPGIRVDRLKSLLPNSVKISSPTNLFFENCRATTVGITGTKGKSTTALLVAKLLENNNKKVFVVGNIGDPMLDVLDAADKDSYCVVELSSFQLQDLEFKPDIAIILPILIDHLDYHKTESEYVEAKRNILKDDQQLVICDLQTAQKLLIAPTENLVTFSADSPGANCVLSGGDMLCEINQAQNVLADSIQFIKDKKIPDIDLLAAYAFAVAEKFKFDLEKFDDFKKLPLRVELVAAKNNIDFYNDSASTNPLSTIKAMEMMSDPYILILGGSAKGVGFKQLARTVHNDKNLYKVFLFGDTADTIDAEIKKIGDTSTIVVDSLATVFEKLKADLPLVRAVLFSPACASFDQYKNYKDRGEDYNELVKNINE